MASIWCVNSTRSYTFLRKFICGVPKDIWNLIAFFEQVFQNIQIVSGSLQFRVIDITLDWYRTNCSSVCFVWLPIEEWETMLVVHVIRQKWILLEILFDMYNQILKFLWLGIYECLRRECKILAFLDHLKQWNMEFEGKIQFSCINICSRIVYQKIRLSHCTKKHNENNSSLMLLEVLSNFLSTQNIQKLPFELIFWVRFWRTFVSERLSKFKLIIISS